MRSRVTPGDILAEIRSLRESTERSISDLRSYTEHGFTRVDKRLDTLIDSLADLRSDFERHEHRD